MIYLSCMMQEDPSAGCNMFCSNVSLTEDPEPDLPGLFQGYTLVNGFLYCRLHLLSCNVSGGKSRANIS